MSTATQLLLALGLPLLFLVAVTVLLAEGGHRLPAPLARLLVLRSRLALSFLLLVVTVYVVRLLQSLGR